MNFRNVITEILQRFGDKGIRYGLIGGFALGLWGVSRSTVDLDFLVDREDIESVTSIMQGMGYKCAFQSDNVSQFVSSDVIYGEVDFLHAFREASRTMLNRAVEKEIFGGEVKIRVVMPEDLIGLKLQAIMNDIMRKEGDLSDIRALVSVRGDALDWKIIKEYAAILNATALLKEITRE